VPLDEDDEHIKDEGLVVVLKELHDKVDALVFQAYGWPTNLSDEEIVANLVALNRERTVEEARGVVKWLRPDYQKSRASVTTKPFTAAEEQGEMVLATESGEQKARFPTDELARTAAVMSTLAGATEAMDAARIAVTFQQGRRVEGQIKSTFASLVRMGYASTRDGSAFLLRRAA
jgi:hypothetical protein